MRWIVLCLVVTSCHKSAPECAEAIESLARHVSLGKTALDGAVGLCVKQRFSAELRACLADAASESALQACIAKEPAFADSIKHLEAVTRDATAWTPANQADLDKLGSDQEAVMKQMETAYDAIVDAKTAAEQDARRAALDDLRTKHNAMDVPIKAANTAKSSAQAAEDARKKLCGEDPLLAGCH